MNSRFIGLSCIEKLYFKKSKALLQNEGLIPFQATRFAADASLSRRAELPVGERRAACAPCRISPVSLSHGSRVAFHSNQC